MNTFNFTDFAMETTYESQYSDARFRDDARLMVKFSIEPVLNQARTTEEGRPIYEEQEMITIIIPGNRLSTVHSRITDEYKSRFRDRYARWKVGLEEEVSGTLLEAWGKLSISQIAELKALNIKTVEQLAAMPDNLASSFMGFYGLKQQAENFILAAKESVGTAKLAEELEKRDNEISILKDQLDKLIAATAAEKSTKVSK